MKFLVVLALFAAAAAEPEAEADPYYFYANGYNGYALGHHYPYTYGYGYPYHSYYLPTAIKPAEKKVEEVPAVEEKKAAVTAPYVYHPYVYNYAPYVYNHAVVKPYTYYANSGGAVHIVKREAEISGRGPCRTGRICTGEVEGWGRGRREAEAYGSEIYGHRDGREAEAYLGRRKRSLEIYGYSRPSTYGGYRGYVAEHIIGKREAEAYLGRRKRSSEIYGYSRPSTYGGYRGYVAAYP